MTPQIGDGRAGDEPNLVRVSTVLGERTGPVGAAWATSIATPSAGHSPFVTVVSPGLPVVPFTLFVPAVAKVNDLHESLTRGAAQAGIAAGVLATQLDDPDGLLCLIASVTVGPDATDEDLVFDNAKQAMIDALHLGAAGGPWHPKLTSIPVPENQDFHPPG